MESHIPCSGGGSTFEVVYEERLTSIELIDVAHPFQTSFLNIIKCDQIVVSWDSMDRPHANLMESGEEVLGDVNRRLQS
jgi:hypothetical protein